MTRIVSCDIYAPCPQCKAMYCLHGDGPCDLAQAEPLNDIEKKKLEKLTGESAEMPAEILDHCVGVQCECSVYPAKKWAESQEVGTLLRHGTWADPCAEAHCTHCGYHGPMPGRI